jgi:hypothetical protein
MSMSTTFDPRIEAVDVDTTFSSTRSRLSEDSSDDSSDDDDDDRLRVVLSRKIPTDSSSSVFKPTHTMFWEGKKIVLTHTRHEGTASQQIGHTQEEWDRIASSIEAMLRKKKETQNDFSFSAARFNAHSGQLEYRRNENAPITTEDLYSNVDVSPSAHGVHDITSRSVGTPIKYIRKDLPKKPPIPAPASSAAPPPPVSLPAPVDVVPPADDRPLYKKGWDKFTSLFKRS